MADSPTTTTTPASTTFWGYLKNNVPNHLKLFAIIGAAIGGVFLYNYIKDLKTQLANAAKVQATLAQTYQQQGPSAVAANTQQTQTQVNSAATNAFGSQVMSTMAAQGANITSLTTAIAQTNATVTALTTKLPQQFTPTQQTTASGALTGYPMDEVRPAGAPSLSNIDIFYDPKQSDPNKAFAGTKWTAYQEQFSAATGDWVKQSDGSFRTSVSLKRVVSKPDPTDATKLVAVGTETIPITGASTIYTPKGLLQASDITPPRWTLGLGLADSKANGYTAAGHLDYRITDRFGIFIGSANNALTGGVSIRLDSKKN